MNIFGKIVYGLQVAAIGLVVVFLGLAILIAFITLMAQVFKAVDAKKLLDDISDVLFKKPADPKKSAHAGRNADPLKNVDDAKLKNQIDDLGENLNINAILNGN